MLGFFNAEKAQYTILMVSSTIAGVLKVILFAKLLGVEEYGVYNIILSLYIFIMFLGSMGLNEGLVKYGSFSKGEQNTEKLRKYTNICIYLGGIGVAIVATLFFLFMFVFDSDLSVRKYVLILAIFAFSSYLFNIASTYLRISHEFVTYAKFLLFKNSIVIFTVVILLLFIDVGAVVVVLLESLVCVILSLVILNSHKVIDSIKNVFSEVEYIIRSLRSGMPVMLAMIMRNLSLNSDKWVIGIMLGVESVGIYSFSMIIFQISMILFNYISTIVGAKWLSEYGKSQSLVNAYGEFIKIVKLTIVFSSIFMVCMLLLAPYIVNMFFDRYTMALPLLPFVLIGSVGMILSLLIEIFLIALSREASVFNISLTSSFVMFGLIFIAYLYNLEIIYFALIFMVSRLITLAQSVYMMRRYKNKIFSL